MPDAHHPLAGHLTPGRHGAAGPNPVRLSTPRRDIVQIAARKGQTAALKAALKAAFGLELGEAGHATYGGGLTALPIQPDAWVLVSEPRGEGALAAEVKKAVGVAGSVVDQTHGRCVIALTGERAPEVMARFCRIDLHPAVFGPGRAAVTPMAELFCVLSHGPAAHYEMILFSTFADSFFHSVITAAATTGYEIV
ncbi:MAG: sarcosine oxidase subunit gamma [Elsteraceae bacterium]